MPPRRSPLCSTCGDNTIKSTSAKVMAIIIAIGLFIVASYLVFSPRTNDIYDVVLIAVIIFVSIIISMFGVIYIYAKEKN